MWTDQDDFDEETDIMIMTALEERENKKSSEGGSCLIFALALAGMGAMPWIWLLGKMIS